MERFRRFTIFFFIAALVITAVDKFYIQAAKDTTAPELKLPAQALECSVNADKNSLLIGAEAVDDKDGDLTDQIFIESLSPFIAENTRLMTAAVVDHAGNVAKATREVIYSDYKHPRFSMSGPLNFYLGTSNLTENIGARDFQEGDISANVKVSTTYSLKDNYGDYPMEFVASNSLGDTIRFTATVTMLDVATILYAPTLELTNYLIYADKEHKVEPVEYIKSVTINSRVYENLSALYEDEKESKEENQGNREGIHEVVAGISSSVFREDDEKTESERDGDEAGEEEYGDSAGSYEGMKLTASDDYPYSDSMPENIDITDIKIVTDIDYEKNGTYEVSYYYTYNDYTACVRLVVIVE